MARPKRKAADTVESFTPRRSQRNATRSGETYQEPKAKRRKTPMRTCKKTSRKGVEHPLVSELRKRKAGPKAVDGSADTHPAATFKPPKNPRATFEGLPAELRLQIYEILSQSTMIHVHRTRQDGKPFIDERGHVNKNIKFKWTPCRGTNPKTPLLCANPKWSGMCKEEDRCTYKINEPPPEPRGYWALATCNKAIRREMNKLCFLRTVVSIHPDDIAPWICYIMRYARKDFEQVRHITLAGQDAFCINYCAVILLRACFPKLQSVGLQCQSPLSDWGAVWDGSRWVISDDDWAYWRNIELALEFNPSVTFVFEAMVWQGTSGIDFLGRHMRQSMSAIRIFAHGMRGSLERYDWEEEIADWSREVVHYHWFEDPKRNAKWRAWWRTKQTKDYCWL